MQEFIQEDLIKAYETRSKWDIAYNPGEKGYDRDFFTLFAKQIEIMRKSRIYSNALDNEKLAIDTAAKKSEITREARIATKMAYAKVEIAIAAEEAAESVCVKAEMSSLLASESVQNLLNKGYGSESFILPTEETNVVTEPEIMCFECKRQDYIFGPVVARLSAKEFGVEKDVCMIHLKSSIDKSDCF